MRIHRIFFFKTISDSRSADGHGQEENNLRATDVGSVGMDTDENQRAGKP